MPRPPRVARLRIGPALALSPTANTYCLRYAAGASPGARPSDPLRTDSEAQPLTFQGKEAPRRPGWKVCLFFFCVSVPGGRQHSWRSAADRKRETRPAAPVLVSGPQKRATRPASPLSPGGPSPRVRSTRGPLRVLKRCLGPAEGAPCLPTRCWSFWCAQCLLSASLLFLAVRYLRAFFLRPADRSRAPPFCSFFPLLHPPNPAVSGLLGLSDLPDSVPGPNQLFVARR